MIATTGSDAAVVYCTQFYMFAMRRVSHSKHTHSTGGKRKLSSGSDSSSDAGTLSPSRRDDVRMAEIHAQSAMTPPFVPLQNTCSSFDALFSTNTHLSFFLLFTAQHGSMFFRFFLYDSSRLYWIQEKNLCCYYLKSFFFACKVVIFEGKGKSFRDFIFASSSCSLNNNLTMGISKTIFSLVKSCRQTTG